MSDPEMEKALWDMSNAITAFAIVQTVGFAYVAIDPKNAEVLSKSLPIWGTRIGSVVFVVAYIAAIWTCYSCRPLAESDKHFDAWYYTTWGRMIAVFLSGVIPFVSTFGRGATHA